MRKPIKMKLEDCIPVNRKNAKVGLKVYGFQNKGFSGTIYKVFKDNLTVRRDDRNSGSGVNIYDDLYEGERGWECRFRVDYNYYTDGDGNSDEPLYTSKHRKITNWKKEISKMV